MNEHESTDLAAMVNDALNGKVLGTTFELFCAVESLHEATHVIGDAALHETYNDFVERIQFVPDEDEPQARVLMAEWIERTTDAIQCKLRDSGVDFISFWVMHRFAAIDVPAPSFRRWTIRAHGSGVSLDG